MTASDVLRRLERQTILVLTLAALALLIYRPGQPGLWLGVVGGGVLVGLAYWALRGVVAAMTEGGIRAGNPRVSGRLMLVKFFTRHAILALAAYGMMTRLDLHPVGMFVGVAAPGIAAALEAVRSARRP